MMGTPGKGDKFVPFKANCFLNSHFNDHYDGFISTSFSEQKEQTNRKKYVGPYVLYMQCITN